MTALGKPLANLDLVPFDPFGMEFRVHPEAFHQRLFDVSPGFIDMQGVASAFVATYAHCTAVLRDFKRFSSLKPAGLPGMERIDFFNSLPVMNYSDPPDHTRRRKVVNPAFTPKRTELLNEGVTAHVNELLDRLLPAGGFDVMSELAKPMAIKALLTRFMGVADADQVIFLNYVKTLSLLDALKPGDPKPQPFLDAWEKGRTYCRDQQALARRGACDNMVGLIANSAEAGSISDDEMMAMMVVLLIGGVSTVAGAVATTIMNLARHPDVAGRIRKDPALAANHLEESLRLDPPVSLVMRFATEDFELGGKAIQKGMPVYAMIATACHDPAVFPDPYVFNVDRANAKDHLAFGYGIHTCIGNAITRNLAPEIVRIFANRAPHLRIADGPDALVWDTSTPRARHIGKLRVAV